MMNKEGSTKIVHFMTPWAEFNSRALIRQTKYVVMMTKERFTKIVNFMTPGAGVLVLGRDSISHIVKMYYSFKNLLLNSQA